MAFVDNLDAGYVPRTARHSEPFEFPSGPPLGSKHPTHSAFQPAAMSASTITSHLPTTWWHSKMPSVDTLLICPDFFGYASDIKNALERRGSKVLWLDGERHPANPLNRILISKFPTLVAALSGCYFSRALRQIRNCQIMYILVIKGEALSVSMIWRFKRAFPNAIFTLYLWDSLRHMGSSVYDKTFLFDRCFTFDPLDSKRENWLQYRPLFFAPAFYGLSSKHSERDILFFGSMHTDRYLVLKKLKHSLCGGITFKIVLYYPSRFLFRIRRLYSPYMWKANINDFRFTPYDRKEMTAMVSRSRVVVDIENANQSGFTMRTIETLGAGRKLATTNIHVTCADFFVQENIFIMDRNNPSIPRRFIDGNFTPLPTEVLYRYSLDGWLDDVLPETIGSDKLQQQLGC
jgi:hypothetical protein